MNEVKLLNIGGIDQNIKDQYARDVIAPSENGLDSSTNLPVSSRHYDEGEYLIGQTRAYYEVIAEINVGDTIVVGTNVRATTVSDELIALKNQSTDVVIEIIADKEDGALATQSYTVGKYIYWAYGLTAGLYIVTAPISSGDALVSGAGGNIAPANKVCDDIAELKKEVASISNPNLIDNPWFTVNQRNVTSWDSNVVEGIFVDRWRHEGGSTGSISNGIMVCDKNVYQVVEDERLESLLGRKVTISWLLSNGTIGHETFTLPNILPSAYTIYGTNDYVVMLLKSGNYSQIARIKPNVNVRAVKLEIGEVSTLHVDAAPNYQQELAKCQRYFVRMKLAHTYAMYSDAGFVGSSTNCRVPITLPTTLRRYPNIRLSGSFRVLNATDYTTMSTNITGVSSNSFTGNRLFMSIEGSGFITGKMALLAAVQNDTNTYIDFSAEI